MGRQFPIRIACFSIFGMEAGRSCVFETWGVDGFSQEHAGAARPTLPEVPEDIIQIPI